LEYIEDKKVCLHLQSLDAHWLVSHDQPAGVQIKVKIE
jgi:hypothetical protein